MERLERVRLLADAHEGDGAARDVTDGERGAAARIAVHLGEDHRVDPDRLVELVGDRDRVLARHRVHDEQHVMGRDLASDRLQLGQERLVDVEPAGGVEDERRQTAARRFLARGPTDLERRLSLRPGHRDPELSAERPELVHRGGPLRVGGREQRMLPLLAVEAGELGGRRRLAGALEPHQHDDRRGMGRGRETVAAAAEQLDELAVDDLHDLLGRGERRQNVLSHGLVLHAVDEGTDHLEVDVRLEERHAHLAQRLLDVLLRQPAAAAELVEDGLQSRTQGIEHGNAYSTGTSVEDQRDGGSSKATGCRSERTASAPGATDRSRH